MFKHNQLAGPSIVTRYMQLAFKAFHDIPYHGDIDAPNSWPELKLWNAGHRLGIDSLPVFNGASEFTIYASEADNVMFRAWHDALHIKYQKPFTLKGELFIAHRHDAELAAISAPYHVRQTIYADVASQVKYYYHTGEFVKNQKAFIEFIVNGGDYKEWTQ